MSVTIIHGDIAASTPVALKDDPYFKAMKESGVELYKLFVIRARDLGKSRTKAAVSGRKIATTCRDVLKKFNALLAQDACSVSSITILLLQIRMSLSDETVHVLGEVAPYSVHPKTKKHEDFDNDVRLHAAKLLHGVSMIFGF